MRSRRSRVGLWWGASLALHGALGFWLLRAPNPTPSVQDPPVVELELSQRGQPRDHIRPRQRDAQRRSGAIRDPSFAVNVAPSPASSQLAAGPSASLASLQSGAEAQADSSSFVEERWRLPEHLKNYEIVRAALRKAQPARLCNGALDGVLSAREKTFCFEAYWGGGTAKMETAKRLSPTP